MEDPREVQVGKKIPVGQSVGPDSFNGHISPLWWTFVLGRDLPSLTNLVPRLWKEDHLGLTHHWRTRISVQDLFYFYTLSTRPYVLTYNYVYVHVHQLLDKLILTGIEVRHRRTTLAIELGLYKKVLRIKEIAPHISLSLLHVSYIEGWPTLDLNINSKP